MKPFLSIIIPYYNASDTIGRLLNSIYYSKNAPVFEVIIVDDGSKENFQIPNYKFQININHQLTNNKSKNKNKLKNLKYIRLKMNMGPAAARNRGAKMARGKFLLFLDSDVELFPDTLRNLTKIYTDDPDIVAVTGVWVKEQRTQAFFPNYKALRDWSYWINERDKSGYYYLFSTRIASIKKAVFMRLKGFDERYSGALVEDIELTYRIARRYAIIFAPNVRVHHEFENFWPIAKKYFLRAYYWTKLYATRRKFDPVATTVSEAVTAVTGVAAVVFGIINIIGLIFIVSGIWNYELRAILPVIIQSIFVVPYSLFLILLLIHIYLIRKFLVFMYKEKGLIFAVKGFFTGLILYCFISAGALWGRLHN
jgi:glycosyltransferase involved in cell wall biosynthesis